MPSARLPREALLGSLRCGVQERSFEWIRQSLQVFASQGHSRCQGMNPKFRIAFGCMCDCNYLQLDDWNLKINIQINKFCFFNCDGMYFAFLFSYILLSYQIHFKPFCN